VIGLQRLPAIGAMILAMVTAPLRAQTPTGQASPPTRAPDRTIHVTLGAATIDDAAIGTLFRGIFRAAGTATPNDTLAALEGQHHNWSVKVIDTITKDPSVMPAGFRYGYYAGRDANSGNEVVWQAKPTKSDDGAVESEQLIAAYALAALDAGSVGEPWKTLYDQAADRPSRLKLGKDIVRVINAASDQQKSITDADVAWIRQNITIGLPRSEVYAALRSRGLVAYNYAYAPGRPIGSGKLVGCDTTDESAKMTAAWPYAGEPLPKPTGGCATIPHATLPEPFPSAYITLPGSFTLGCGSEINVAMTFGPADRLKKLHISKPDWECV
jgi:hypothetical protein